VNDGYWPLNPCARPLTFHHLLPWQIQALHEIQTSVETSGSRFTTYADVYAGYLEYEEEGFSEQGKMHANRPGMDYRSVEFPGARSVEDGAQRCHQRCRSEEVCRSWSYDSGTCFLKHGISRTVRKENVFSGVIHKAYQCEAGI
jgi:hypothetical protein